MIPTHNELKAYVERIRANAPAPRGRLEAAAALGTKVRTVVDHPGWQEFVRRLEERRDSVQQTRDGHVERLATSAEPDVLALRLNIRELDGELRALDGALAIVPGILKEAADAAANLRA